MRWALALVVVSGCSFTMHTVARGGAQHCDDSYVSPILDTVAVAGAAILTTWGAITHAECKECYVGGLAMTVGIIVAVPTLVAAPVGFVRATQCRRWKRRGAPA